MTRQHRQDLILITLGLTAALTLFPRHSEAGERFDRQVDRAALASQDAAVAKLSGLLKRYRGTAQEPVFLAKLAELQQQNAGIRFRIAHGSGSLGKLELDAYKKMMRSTIGSLTELIRKYPHYVEIHQAYYMRGHAYEEIEEKKPAAVDYLYLTKHFPEAEECIPAYMSLAAFSIETGDHARAITYLKEVEKRPDSPHYPFALYKLAWSHYNLKNVPAALSYAERQVRYYDARTANSDVAFRENMLLDSTLFYLEGFEQKREGYASADALSYFRKLDGSGASKGTVLGRMMVKYSKLLRAHTHEQDLIAFKKLALEEEHSRPESLDVLMTVFEHQFNKRRFPEMIALAGDMMWLYARHPQHDSFPKAQKQILDAADSIQKAVVANKHAQGAKALSETLAALYDSFTKITVDTDPRVPRVHYNLAETLFEIHEYEGATRHYRWIVDRIPAKKLAKELADSALKAVSSRYESLHVKGVIPKQIVAVARGSEKSLGDETAEWIGWVDLLHDEQKTETADHFYFEANRVLYSLGHVEKSVERLRKFALKQPSSKFAVPSASLALDTAIVGQDWEKTLDLALELRDVDAWKKAEFHEKVSAVAADAAYKLAEIRYAAKEYASALKLVSRFLDRYAASARLDDALFIGGNSALALGERAEGLKLFTRLIQERPKSPLVDESLLARAALHENGYDFGPASADYRAYLEKPAEKKDRAKLRQKTFALAWLSGDASTLEAATHSKAVCVADEECERYRALLALESKRGLPDTKELLRRSKEGEDDARAIWALAGLAAEKLSFHDRLSFVRQVAKHWSDLDSTAQFALLPRLSKAVPQAFEQTRGAMKEFAPLRPNARYITHRVESIRVAEQAAAKVLKMPWARVRSSVLNEIASLYLDLAHGLRDLPAPKDMKPEELAEYEGTISKLVLPFEEKGQEMRAKAFEVASTLAVEPDTLARIAEPFFADNPSQAKLLAQPVAPSFKRRPLDLVALDRLDRAGDWDSVVDDADDDRASDETLVRLKARWALAVRGGNFGQVAFFLQEAREKKLLDDAAMAGVKAVTLALAGAQAEGLAELDDQRSSLGEKERREAVLLMISQYNASLARERVLKLIGELGDSVPSELRSAVPAQTASK